MIDKIQINSGVILLSRSGLLFEKFLDLKLLKQEDEDNMSLAQFPQYISFIEWLIKKIDVQTKKSPEGKQELLRMLKFETENVLENIRDNLGEWVKEYVLISKRPAIINYEEYPKEILAALKRHFAKELAEITETVEQHLTRKEVIIWESQEKTFSA